MCMSKIISRLNGMLVLHEIILMIVKFKFKSIRIKIDIDIKKINSFIHVFIAQEVCKFNL